MWSWEVEGREKLFSRILCLISVWECLSHSAPGSGFSLPWKTGHIFSIMFALSSSVGMTLGFLLFLLPLLRFLKSQLSSYSSSTNLGLSRIQWPPLFASLSVRKDGRLLTDGDWRSHCDWTVQSHRKAAAKKEPSFASQPKRIIKRKFLLENLRSFQSFLDSLKNCSPFLRERQQCDRVAPWAHWQNKRNLFRKNTRRGPPDRERARTPEVSRGKRVSRAARHGFKIYPNYFAFLIFHFCKANGRAWAWNQMK